MFKRLLDFFVDVATLRDREAEINRMLSFPIANDIAAKLADHLEGSFTCHDFTTRVNAMYALDVLDDVMAFTEARRAHLKASLEEKQGNPLPSSMHN